MSSCWYAPQFLEIEIWLAWSCLNLFLTKNINLEISRNYPPTCELDFDRILHVLSLILFLKWSSWSYLSIHVWYTLSSVVLHPLWSIQVHVSCLKISRNNSDQLHWLSCYMVISYFSDFEHNMNVVVNPPRFLMVCGAFWELKYRERYPSSKLHLEQSLFQKFMFRLPRELLVSPNPFVKCPWNFNMF